MATDTLNQQHQVIKIIKLILFKPIQSEMNTVGDFSHSVMEILVCVALNDLLYYNIKLAKLFIIIKYRW